MTTSNQFQTLPLDEDNQDTNDKPYVAKPPPVFIPSISNVKDLTALLSASVTDFTVRIIGNNQAKIQPATTDGYREIVKILQQNGAEFHTYQLKSEKKYRVVVRNLHHSADIDDIKLEIENHGHKVANIHNIRHHTTKEPLSMFFVDLEPAANNKTIFDIKYLQYMKIVIEPPRVKRTIPQCAKCQRYGHTKTYCFREPRCVKCGNEHASQNCEKSRETEAQCALCRQKHPANYKGCVVYKEIRNKRFPPPRKIIFPTQTTPIMRSSFINPNVTFAQMARENTQHVQDVNNDQHKAENSDNKLEQIMLKLIDKMDGMFTLLTTLITKLINGSNP